MVHSRGFGRERRVALGESVIFSCPPGSDSVSLACHPPRPAGVLALQRGRRHRSPWREGFTSPSREKNAPRNHPVGGPRGAVARRNQSFRFPIGASPCGAKTGLPLDTQRAHNPALACAVATAGAFRCRRITPRMAGTGRGGKINLGARPAPDAIQYTKRASRHAARSAAGPRNRSRQEDPIAPSRFCRRGFRGAGPGAPARDPGFVSGEVAWVGRDSTRSPAQPLAGNSPRSFGRASAPGREPLEAVKRALDRPGRPIRPAAQS